jgi:hypothetical protein
MEAKERPAYYAVLSAEVRYDKRLCANAKLLYAEITALCNKRGYCWSSNGYFAGLYGVSCSAVSGWVKALERAGYIECALTYVPGTREIRERRIRLVHAAGDETAPAPGAAAERESAESDALADEEEAVRELGAPTEEPAEVFRNLNRYSEKTGRYSEKTGRYTEKTKENSTDNTKGNSTGPALPETSGAAARVKERYRRNYCALFKEEPAGFDTRAVNWLIREAVSARGEERVLKALDIGAGDSFCCERGYILKTILSANVLSRLLHSKRANRKADGNVTVWLDAMRDEDVGDMFAIFSEGGCDGTFDSTA